jgi:hypothetical protein
MSAGKSRREMLARKLNDLAPRQRPRKPQLMNELLLQDGSVPKPNCAQRKVSATLSRVWLKPSVNAPRRRSWKKRPTNWIRGWLIVPKSRLLAGQTPAAPKTNARTIVSGSRVPMTLALR